MTTDFAPSEYKGVDHISYNKNNGNPEEIHVFLQVSELSKEAQDLERHLNRHGWRFKKAKQYQHDEALVYVPAKDSSEISSKRPNLKIN